MKFLLAVRILTYNHEGFIRKCLESVVAQKANFRFKAIIGEDYSTDKTAFICKEFEKHYPDLIELHCSTFNNLQVNSSKNWEKCITFDAKYIAILEGDDYWSDPLKLQKQVDFLEANPHYSAVFGSTEVLQENPKKSSTAFANFGDIEDCDLMLEDVLKEKMPVHISSILFRREVLSPAFLKQNKGVVPGDRYTAAGCFLKGKVRYLAQPFSVYRRHSSGISETIEHFGVGLHAGNVHMLLKLLKLFPQQSERNVLTSYLNWRLNETAYAYRRIFEFSAKRRALKLIYRFYPFQLFVKFFLRETLIQLFPRLIQRIHAPSQPA
jgi:glycosyltransferase involved in cell wall biosynthesis